MKQEFNWLASMNIDTKNTTSQSDIVYPMLSYRMKVADDGTTARYDYKWNDTGKALTEEEEVNVVENCRKSMKLMKYIVLKSWNDYDCSAPCAEIVDDTTYKCGSAWIEDTDSGQMLYNIQTLNLATTEDGCHSECA